MGYSCRIFRMPMPAAKWGPVGLHMPSRRLAYAIPWACICRPVGLHMPSRGTTFGIPHDQFIIHSSVFWLRN